MSDGGGHLTRAILADLEHADTATLDRLARLLAPHLPRPADTGDVVPLAVAAPRLGTTAKALERQCRAGRIAGARKVGHRWRVPVDAEILPPASRRPASLPLVDHRRRAA